MAAPNATLTETLDGWTAALHAPHRRVSAGVPLWVAICAGLAAFGYLGTPPAPEWLAPAGVALAVPGLGVLVWGFATRGTPRTVSVLGTTLRIEGAEDDGFPAEGLGLHEVFAVEVDRDALTLRTARRTHYARFPGVDGATLRWLADRLREAARAATGEGPRTGVARELEQLRGRSGETA